MCHVGWSRNSKSAGRPDTKGCVNLEESKITVDISTSSGRVAFPPADDTFVATNDAGSNYLQKRSPSRDLVGRKAAVVVFSYYPDDPRPRRAAEALVNEGMNVDVICLRQDKTEASRETFGGVNILRLPIKRQRGGKFAYIWQYSSFIILSFLLLTWRTLTHRYQLIHVHNMPDVLVFSALIPKLFGAKVILDIHDPMPELMMTIFGFGKDSFGVNLLKKFEKLSLWFADVVLTVNLACKKILSSRSCPSPKVRVIMNSPDESIFEYLPLGHPKIRQRDSARPFVLMYHGSLVERHGLDLAIKALQMVQNSTRNFELRIYGQRTPFLEQVMNLVKDSDLNECVHYYGQKDIEQVRKAIDECDLGIIPNRRSVFTEINTPTRIFEYLSRGKPVIAPAAPGIADYFNDRQLILFELGDANDLARAIEYAILNPDEVKNIVKRGQEVYREHNWSCERMEFLNLVGKLLGPSTRRA